MRFPPLTRVGLMACLLAFTATLVNGDASRSTMCRFGIPEGSNSYIIDCLTADKCNLLAKSLTSILGASSGIDVLRSLAILTGRFDASIIRLLCANADLGNLVGGIELDAVVGLDEVIRT